MICQRGLQINTDFVEEERETPTKNCRIFNFTLVEYNIMFGSEKCFNRVSGYQKTVTKHNPLYI